MKKLVMTAFLLSATPALAGYEHQSNHTHMSYAGVQYESGSLQDVHASADPAAYIGCILNGAPGAKYVICSSSYSTDNTLYTSTTSACWSTDPTIIEAVRSINPASRVSFAVPSGSTLCSYVIVESSSAALRAPHEVIDAIEGSEESVIASIYEVVYSETEWLASLISYYGGW